MQTKNIANNTALNIKNCEEEAIHIPGTIQPHGFLLAVNKDTLLIEVCSENIGDFLDIKLEEILGTKAHTIFGENVVTLFSLKLVKFVFKNKIFSIQCHSTENHIVVESEQSDNKYSPAVDIYGSSVQLLHYIENGQNLRELVTAVAKAVKELTQYDRVMIYRFDAQYNGEVIAEEKEADLDPYIGLHYPHTDIPAQARELYLLNQLRVVGRVDYQPIPLLTTEQSGLNHLDLSLSSLRSVSPIHLEYLQNMGVGATLTVSLVHEGKLWGLIACHHRQAKYLTQEMKAAVKLQGHFITSQIHTRVKNEENEISQLANACVEHLLEKPLILEYSSINTLFEDRAIIDLCNSVGVCAIINQTIYSYGLTPNEDEIRRLTAYLHVVAPKNNLHTDRLATIVDDLPSVITEFPGVNYYSIGEHDNCIIWFRKKTSKEIVWAGEPNQKLNQAQRLSPRKSFDRWIEDVDDQSRQWLNSELVAAKNFVRFFEVHIRSVALNAEKDAQRKLAETLNKTNTEIEHLQWVTSHDLQEPLRKISMMASIIGQQESESIPASIKSKVAKIQLSAQRMRDLISDIVKYSKTTEDSTDLAPVDLNLVFKDVHNELQDNLDSSKMQLEYGELPTVLGVRFLLVQVFSNILQNAIKFKDNNKTPIVRVSTSIEQITSNIESKQYVKISIADNGIGFDNAASEKIFKLFVQLHRSGEFSGTGVGLALCRKILSKHNGFIKAESEAGVGATFSVYFPSE